MITRRFSAAILAAFVLFLITTVAHAQQVLIYAQQNGIDTLSIWAIQRDNGRCPGSTGSNSCSGIVQNPWDFSHVLDPFTQ